MPRLPALTLVSALLLGLSLVSSPAPVTALVGDSFIQRDSHSRMIKRYNLAAIDEANEIAVRGIIGGIIGDSTTSSSSSSSAAGAKTTAASTTEPVDHTTAADETTTTPTSSSSSSTTTTTSTSSSTTSTETSSSTSTTETHQTSITSNTETSSTTSPSAAKTTLTSTVYDDGNSGNSTSSADTEKAASESRIPKNVQVILIVVVSVIAGLGIIWTAVRKWKFRASRSFQDRLAPIDWQPDSDKPHAGAAPMAETYSDNVSIRRNMFSDEPNVSGAPGTLAPPAHDFTAGPARSASPLSIQRTASPAPYGGRSASPGPAAAYGGARAASPGPAVAYDTSYGATAYDYSGYGNQAHDGAYRGY